MATAAMTKIAAATFCHRRTGAAAIAGAAEGATLVVTVAAGAAALVPLGGVITATPGVLEAAGCKAASRIAPEEDVGIAAEETRLESVSRFRRARSVRSSAACW